MRDDPYTKVLENKVLIEDKFEGWELVEFLQISAEDVLDAMAEFGWLDDDNIDDFMDFVGLREEKDSE